MRNQWKRSEKMNEDLNYDLIWGHEWPGNWASDKRHIFQSSSYRHVNYDWCETSGNCLRKWPKTGIFIYFRAQSGPQFGPLRPIFSTPLKVVTMSMGIHSDVKLVVTFWKIIKDRNFGPILWPQNWALEAHVVLISENSPNENLNQSWCESKGKFLTK